MPARRNRPPKRVRANCPPPPRVGLNEDEGSRRPNNSAVPLTHLAGLVMWLPPEEEITVDTNFQGGCYDHPVLILSPQPSEGEVVILIMTSLGGMDLLQKYPRNMALRRKHLPVYPSNPHPDLDILLSLQDGKTLTKSSYIRTKRQHSIEFAALRPYRGSRTDTKHYGLTSESYQQVIKHAGFHAPIPSPVATTIRSGPVLDTSHQLGQGIDFDGLLGHTAREERLNLRGAARGYGTIASTRDYSYETAPTETLYDAYVRRYEQSSRSVTSLPLYHDTQARGTNHHVTRHSSRHPSRGRNSSHPILRDFILPLVMVLAVGAGAGFGMYSAWVYRAALGKVLVNGILWVGEHGFEFLKAVGKLAWRFVAWLGEHVVEMDKWVSVKGWEVIKGMFSRLS